MTTYEFIYYLNKIHNGYIEAIEPIFNEFYPKMKMTAYGILRNDADAEDAASNALICIVRHAQNNEHPRVEKCGAYVSKIARNEAIRIKQAKKVFTSFPYSDEIALTTDTNSSILDKLVVNSALMKLEDEDRTIAEMYYYYGYKVKHISKELNIPIGTIKWRLSEIRKNMSKYLK